MSKKKLSIFLILPFFLLLTLGATQVFGAKNHVLDQTTRLAALSKVWGFLKYYHPEVAKGEIDWDQVLISAVPKVKAAQDYDSFNQEIQIVLQEAGNIDINEFNAGTSAHPNEKLFKWMKHNHIFNHDVRKILTTLQKKHIGSENYYYQEMYPGGPLMFINEKRYDDTYYPNENLRMLALFRFWNIIEYFYPYKKEMDQPWEDTLLEFIPRMLNASGTEEYQLALRELNTRLNDSHGIFWSPFWRDYRGNFFAPFEASYIEGKNIVTRVFPELLDSPNDIKVGDIVVQCRGQNVEDFKNSWRKYTEASNESAMQRNLCKRITWGHSDRLEFKFERDGIVKDVTVTGYIFSIVSNAKKKAENLLKKWDILPGNIGYIYAGTIQTSDVYQAMAELKNTKAIIFDVRNNAIGTMYWFCNFLIPTPTPFSVFTLPDLAHPGEFYLDEPLTSTWEDNPDYYKGRVVILMNEVTQSHGEFTVMSLETAPDATKIGSQTGGADGNTTRVWLPGYAMAFFTGIGVYYPDGSPTQRIGIIPDIEIRPTISGIQAGNDEVLERAVKFIETGN